MAWYLGYEETIDPAYSVLSNRGESSFVINYNHEYALMAEGIGSGDWRLILVRSDSSEHVTDALDEYLISDGTFGTTTYVRLYHGCHIDGTRILLTVRRGSDNMLGTVVVTRDPDAETITVGSFHAMNIEVFGDPGAVRTIKLNFDGDFIQFRTSGSAGEARYVNIDANNNYTVGAWTTVYTPPANISWTPEYGGERISSTEALLMVGEGNFDGDAMTKRLYVRMVRVSGTSLVLSNLLEIDSVAMVSSTEAMSSWYIMSNPGVMFGFGHMAYMEDGKVACCWAFRHADPTDDNWCRTCLVYKTGTDTIATSSSTLVEPISSLYKHTGLVYSLHPWDDKKWVVRFTEHRDLYFKEFSYDATLSDPPNAAGTTFIGSGLNDEPSIFACWQPFETKLLVLYKDGFEDVIASTWHPGTSVPNEEDPYADVDVSEPWIPLRVTNISGSGDNRTPRIRSAGDSYR